MQRRLDTTYKQLNYVHFQNTYLELTRPESRQSLLHIAPRVADPSGNYVYYISFMKKCVFYHTKVLFIYQI